MSTGQVNSRTTGECAVVETHDSRVLSRLFPALRRLRADRPRPECKRELFVFRDRSCQRGDVLSLHNHDAAVRPLAFPATIKQLKALLHNA